MLSVGAWFLLRRKHVDLGKATIRCGVARLCHLQHWRCPLFGAEQAKSVTHNQPVKLAAMEGIWEDEACAPMTLVVGWMWKIRAPMGSKSPAC